MDGFMTVIGVWIGALFTLAIFSFLYRDNPLYKIAEQIFIGLSAGYTVIITIYDILLPNLWTKLETDFAGNAVLLVPTFLGILIIMRLIPKLSWLSRYPISLMIGMSSGIGIIRVMDSNIIRQIMATMVNPFESGNVSVIVGQLLVTVGTITAFMYFYFSRKQEGWMGGVSKVGIYFLMISFGSAFGFTTMARISLLIGRLEYLLGDWLGILAK